MIIDLMTKYDIPLRFEPALVDYATTGRLSGLELKCRVATLSNFKAVVEQIAATFQSPLPPLFTDASYEVHAGTSS